MIAVRLEKGFAIARVFLYKRVTVWKNFRLSG